MDFIAQIRTNKRLAKHKSILLIVSSLLFASNLLLISYLVNSDTKVLIIPSNTSREFTLSSKTVSDDYLELMSRDIANIVLNLTPENYQYSQSAILKLSHPASFGKIKQELDELADDIKKRNVTIHFSVQEINVDNVSFASEVKGLLETRIGLRTVSKEEKVYKILFDYSFGYLNLKEFYEVKNNE